MSLDLDSCYYLPVELIGLVMRALPLKQRYSMAMLSARHAKYFARRSMSMSCLSDEQEVLMTRFTSEMLNREHKIVHLKLPAGSGKTLIALMAAFEPGGFVRGGDRLIVCCPPNLRKMWVSEVRKRFKGIAAIDTGSIGHRALGALFTSLPADASAQFRRIHASNVLVMSPLALKKLLNAPNLPATLATNLLIDEGHLNGVTAEIIAMLGDPLQTLITKTGILSANIVSGVDENLVLSGASPIHRDDMPTIVRHYHDRTNVVVDPDAFLLHPPDVRNSRHDRHLTSLCGGIAECVPYLAETTLGNTVRKVVFFTSRLLHVQRWLAKRYLNLTHGSFMLFIAHSGGNISASVAEFEAYKGDAAIFVSYGTAGTGFSIRANESYLFDLPLSGDSVYQASRRLVRLVNTNADIHIHYIAASPLEALLKCAASEYTSHIPKLKVNVKNGWHTVLPRRLARFGLTIDTCPLATALYLANPTHYARHPAIMADVPDIIRSDATLTTKARRKV